MAGVRSTNLQTVITVAVEGGNLNKIIQLQLKRNKQMELKTSDIRVGDRVYVNKKMEAADTYVDTILGQSIVSNRGEAFRDVPFDGLVRGIAGDILSIDCESHKDGKIQRYDRALVRFKHVVKIEKVKQ